VISNHGGLNISFYGAWCLFGILQRFKNKSKSLQMLVFEHFDSSVEDCLEEDKD
jgi:hypothetical protein